MKKILIAGGAGFLGSHLCTKLVDKNKVYCVDNLYTGRISNIEKLIENNNFEFINHNIINRLDIEVDEIYNLACPASPVHYQKDAIYTLNTSIIGIINLLELAKKNNAKILQASTSEVYGNPLTHPQTEEYWGNVNPIGIRSCYDEGKRCAESYMINYHKHHKIDTKIARIFNTYGENMSKDDGRVISNFINQAIEGKDITVYGDGEQTRSFCYVDDLIDGLIKLMNSDINMPINLGNDNETKIIEIANMVINKTKSNSNIIYKDLPFDDPIKRKPDITKAKKLLNWQPNISLDNGLNKTIKYFIEVKNEKQ